MEITNPSIINQLFNMKKGTRSVNYDAENNIPKWGDQLAVLSKNIALLKEAEENLVSFYNATLRTPPSLDVGTFLSATYDVLEKVSKVELSGKIESMVAEYSMLLIYGMGICANFAPYVQHGNSIESFWKLHSLIHREIFSLDQSFRTDHPFWGKYAFKLGLYSLKVSLAVMKEGLEHFIVDGNFSLCCRQKLRTGWDPVSFLAMYIASDGTILEANTGNTPFVSSCDTIRKLITDSLKK